MEFYLCRAMEVGRLTPEQLIQLQAFERGSKRALMPYEIQESFGLGTMKDHYSIPAEDLNAQARHNQRLRVDMDKLNVSPRIDFSVEHVGDIHKFDERVVTLVETGKLDLFFRERRTQKRFSEQVVA